MLFYADISTRSTKTYVTTFVVFAIIQVYALMLAFYLVARAFGNQKGWDELSSPTVAGVIGNLFTSNTGLVMLALASTWGLYFVASIMYLDPWHMIHSCGAYTLMASSYTNVLNVYAFCNWHDVSWGTKGSDTTEAMPSAKTKVVPGGREVEIIDTSQKDLDSIFEEIVKRCLKPIEVVEEKQEKSLDDSYKNFRTRLITAWIMLNAAVVVVITSPTFDFLGTTVSCTNASRIWARQGC